MRATSAFDKMKYLNLGCGSRFHPEWENVDFYATGPNVRVHDLRERTPYADGTFDVVYHSHVLEHFPREAALLFLRECYRLLKPGGIIRVAVPDLERIARTYLEALEKAAAGAPGWSENHEWMVMEMYDQTIREQSRGALVGYFDRDPIPNWDFVLERWGTYANGLLQSMREDAKRETIVGPENRIAWRYVLSNPFGVLRSKLLRALLKQEDWEALKVGRFRRAGEIHMWMYDFYSLGKALQRAGFRDPRPVGPSESSIPAWSDYYLDIDPDGRVYKADSLYMEAVKP